MSNPLNMKTEHAADKAEQPQVRSCNRHIDCDKADAEAKANGRYYADHCHDDCCEDCFGQ